MGKINLGILDGFSGKVGTVVGYKRNGKKIMRAYVDKMKNPRTESQMNVRLRFKVLTELAKGFRTAIKIGLELTAKSLNHSVSNDFFQKNWGAVRAEGGVAEVDYGNLKLSDGELPEVGFGSANFEEPLRVSVGFTPNSDAPDADADDMVYLFVFQPDSMKGVLSAPVQRSTGSIEMALPSTWSGMTVHVYGFAVGAGRGNSGMRSDGSYVGTGNVG